MNSLWYSKKSPYVGAEFHSMRTIGDNRFAIVYYCPDREYTDVDLIVECDSKDQRDWMYGQSLKMFNGKPYEKGLRNKILNLRCEYEFIKKYNLDFPFSYDELQMLYGWASQEHYYRESHNLELEDGICEKLRKMMKEYENNEEV